MPTSTLTGAQNPNDIQGTVNFGGLGQPDPGLAGWSGMIQKLQRWQQLNETASAQVNDPNLAGRLADFHQRYPWMQPDAKWSLAYAGIDPSSPTAQAAAQAAASIAHDSGLGFGQIGDPVTKPVGTPDLTSVFQSLEQRQQQATVPQPKATDNAAGVSPLQQIFGADWDKLNASLKAKLAGVTVTQDDQFGQQLGLKDQILYKLGGTFNTLDHDQRMLVDQYISKYGTANNLDAYLGYFTPNGGVVKGKGAEDAATPDSSPYISLSKPYVFDKPSISVAGYDVGDLGPVVPIVRTLGMIAAAPHQEVTGEFRNLYQLANNLHDGDFSNMPNFLQSQSDLGVALGDLKSGKPVDVGSGFFVNPQSQVAQERVRRESQRGVFANGDPITLGRSFASDVLRLDPGSKPAMLISGLVDATSAIAADPTVWGLKGVSAARDAHEIIGAENSATKGLQAFRTTGQVSEGFKAYQQAGGLAGLRYTVDPAAANAWLDSPKQAAVLQKIADTNDPYTIWRGLSRQTTPDVAAKLADANTPAEVSSILRDELGTSIRNKFGTSDFGNKIPALGGGPSMQIKTPSRWTQMMPFDKVDGSDLQDNVVNLERVAALTKAPDGQLQQWFDQMARTTQPFQRQAVWQQVMDDTAQRLVGNGVALNRARSLTRLAQDAEATDRVYAVRSVAAGTGNLPIGTMIDGQRLLLPESQPTMLAQTLDGFIPMPNWRELRRALANPVTKAVLENPVAKTGEWGLTQFQRVWKPLQIMTVKTMVKVLGDEQAAIAARGYDSLLNHPIDALSVILATPKAELPEDAGWFARLRSASASGVRWGAGAIPGVNPALATTATGHDFQTLQEIQQVASHGFDAAVDDLGVLRANDWKVLTHNPGVNDTEFANAYARHLAQHAASPEMQGFARADSMQAAQDWYWNGDGSKYRELLATNGRTGRPALLTREGSDAFVKKSFDQIAAVTNNNPDLVNAIATGKLDGTPLWNTVRDGTPKVSKNFIGKLDNYAADMPDVVPQQKAIYSADLAKKQLADRFFARGIHLLLGTPSAVLSKSPLFRQAYWERIIDNAAFLTPDAQTELLNTARGAAQLPKDLLGELETSIARGNASKEAFSGTMTLEQADELAKAHGLNMVQQTTHEFSQRSQAMDMLRLLTPFGEVWRKTIRRWGNIINDNPNVVHRALQGVQALQSPELNQLVGGPASEGFFHTDQNGQEVFTVPGSEWATQAITGVPVPLVGDVKGLSLGTEFFPALGPAVSIPVAWTLNKLGVSQADTPLGKVKDVLFPYGEPNNVTDLWQYAPSWFKNAFGQDRPTSPDAVRVYNNTVIDYIRYGLTNGDYDLSTPEGVQHAVDDASKKSKELGWIRGAAQFFTPGAPSAEFLVRDKTGKLVDATTLIQEFHDMENGKYPGIDVHNAGQAFLDKYGPDIFRSVTPKSYTYTFGIPTSSDSADWVAQHPDVKTNFPNLYGYFAPPSDPNKFDYDVYRSQLDPGQGRAALSPAQWAQIANSRLAGLAYGKARDKVIAANNGKQPDKNQQAWLTAYKAKLIDLYPGYGASLYGGVPGVPGRLDAQGITKYVVPQAQKAILDKTVMATDAGQGLAQYLERRAKVDKSWTDAGYASGSWTQGSSAYAVNLRNYMRSVGDWVTSQHHDFGPLMDNVFEREMRDDTNPNDTGGG